MQYTVSAKGKEKKEEVTAAEIKNTRVLFLPGVELKKRLQDISYTKK